VPLYGKTKTALKRGRKASHLKMSWMRERTARLDNRSVKNFKMDMH